MGQILNGWENLSTGSGSITGIGGRMWLDSDGASNSQCSQEITINEVGVKHILQFEIYAGPLTFRIGDTPGGKEQIEWVGLDTGVHQIEFTPESATVHISFKHTDNAGRALEYIRFVPEGTQVLPSVYTEDQLKYLHYQQIGDVIYIGSDNHWIRRLEWRGGQSWSLTKLLPTDGPFGALNTSATTLSVNRTSGEAVVTASEDLFSILDLDVIYSMTNSGQSAFAAATGGDVQTDAIKVTGIGSTARTFRVVVTGPEDFNGTVVTLQQSSGNENNFTDYRTFVRPGDETIYDAKDNQTYYWRLNLKGGDYTGPGTYYMTLEFSGGTEDGRFRVIQVFDRTTARVEILDDIATTEPTRFWKRGKWSADQGFPSKLAFGFGRLWVGRGTDTWSSNSDNFSSFDEGDADEADKTIATPLATPSSDGVQWLGFMGNLLVGTKTQEAIGLGNTTSEPVAPSNFQIIDKRSMEGSSPIQPVEATNSVLYVHRTGRKLMQFTQDPQSINDTSWTSVDLTRLAPELADSEIIALAAQHEPERRIFSVLKSGQVLELLFRREEDTIAWGVMSSENCRVEDMEVMPADQGDLVYLRVRRRRDDGVWVRALEVFGPDEPITDEALYHADSAVFHDLERRNAVIQASGTQGTITVEADSDIFTGADVGSIIWLHQGRGTVTAVSDARTITVEVTTELDDDTQLAQFEWGIGAPITELACPHLEGQKVSVIADMMQQEDRIVVDGKVTFDVPVTVAAVGLSVRSRWKSLQLAYGAQAGTGISMQKTVKRISWLLHRTANQIRFGKSFKSKDLKPAKLKVSGPNAKWGEADKLRNGVIEPEAFDAGYEADTRICFEIDGLTPATVAAIVPEIDTKDR